MIWLKRFFIVMAAFFALVIALLSYVTLFLDPNNFKTELSTLVKDQANVALRLDGDIKWSFFPWVGLELENTGVSMGGDAEVLQFERVEFGLVISSLLEQKIQVNKINLVNVTASLYKDKNGQGNWQLTAPTGNGESEKIDLNNVLAEPQTSSSSSTSGPSTEPLQLPEIHLQELRIENAKLIYHDEQTNQKVEATLNATIEDVQWDKAWPVVMDIALEQSDLEGNGSIQAKAKLNANLSVFPEREFLSIDSVVLTTELTGEGIPSGSIDAKLSVLKLEADLPQESVFIEGLALSSLGLNVDMKVQAYQVLSDPEFTAMMSLGEFNPRDVMTRLAIELPEMSDDTALTKARANISVEGSATSITAQPISLVLDDTKIEANAVLNLSPLRWDVSLAGANLNLDRYLPAPSEESESDKKETVSAATQDTAQGSEDLIPVELIRNLNGHVDAVFEEVIVKNMKLDKIELDSSQANGVVTVSPFLISLYQGEISSTLTLDARSNTPQIEMSPSVNNVLIKPLLEDFMDLDKLTGTAYLDGELHTQGNQIDDLMVSLQGELLVELRDGALVGTNLTKTVCKGIADIRNEKLDDSKYGEHTPFEVMRFPARIENGNVSTPGLNIRSSGLQITGDGVVSLAESTLAYQADVGLPGSQLDAACEVNEKVAALTFPIVCEGAFDDDPVGLCRPDMEGFASVFADLAAAELKAKLKAEAEAEKARLKAKADAEKERLEEELKDKLKSLF